jgi:hypothetical protein
MAKFTNYTQGPKGLNTEAGLVYVEAGQTVDVELSASEAASAKATGWFSTAKDPLDHDDDGKKGGSAAPNADDKKAA